MPTTLTDKPNERSTAVIQYAFTDETGAAFTPNAGTIFWSLTDSAGTVVNSRNQVAIASAATITIVLSGLDLAVGSGLLDVVRKLLIECEYNSSLGNNLPFKDEVTFEIYNLAKPVGIT